MKVCKTCDASKSLKSFDRTGNGDRRRKECRDCQNSKSSYYVKSLEARRTRAKAWRLANPERYRETKRLWRANNPETHHKHQDAWVARNPEKRKRAAREYNHRNVEAKREYQRAYMAKNKALYNGYAAARRARIKRAVPAWVDFNKIKSVYELAASEGKHVDHIVPLQSPIVCGLHWEGNLQILSDKDNKKKGNRLWPDMP